MSDEKQDLKEEEKTSIESGQSEEKQDEKQEEGVIEKEAITETKEEPDYKALYEKEKEVAENYKKENTKYRRTNRKPLGDEPASVVPPANTPAAATEYALSDDDRRFIYYDSKSKLKDVYDSQFKSKIDNLTDSEYERFEAILASFKPLHEVGISKGSVISRVDAERHLGTAFDMAIEKKEKQDEAIRQKGQAEVIEAQKVADMENIRSIPKKSKANVSDDDKEVEKMTGGIVSAERAKEIREARTARVQEYTPKYNI